MKPVFCILVLAVSWAAAEPPVSNYYHSSPYEDMYSHSHDSPRQVSHQSHSPSSSYPSHSHDDPNVEHEVIIQHHHYPAPSHAGGRVVSHGTPDYHSASQSVVPSAPKKPRQRSRPVYQAVRASSYDAPKTSYATAEPSLYDAYSSSPYKASDYKSYAISSSPVGPSDDYGMDAYSPSHTSEYGTPATYQNQPSYKIASHSYSPPSHYSSPNSGSSSYAAPTYEPHQGGYRLKTQRLPSHKTYGTPLKSYKTTSYGVPKTTYGSPKYVTVSSARPSYSVPKTLYGAPKPSYSKPTYYRQTTKTYAPATSSYSAVAPATYASASPSYAYGSPSTKSHGTYSYADYEKQMEKGYVRFAAAPEDTYGGVYSSAGSSPY